MKIKLEKLKYEVGSLGIVSNDVHVDFDYDEIEDDKICMRLNSYIGIDENKNYRFNVRSEFLFTELPYDFAIEDCLNELVQGKYLEMILFFENMGNEE